MPAVWDATRKGILELVEELMPLMQRQQSADRPGQPVISLVCVAARGPFDDVMTRAVATLLKTHGVEVLGDSNGSMPPANPTGFVPGTSRVLILSAEPGRSISALHLTARRLHQLFSGAMVLAGVYQPDEAKAHDRNADALLEPCTSVGELLKQLRAGPRN